MQRRKQLFDNYFTCIRLTGTHIEMSTLAAGTDYKASNGWLQGFKSQHGVVSRVISGESASANSNASASWVAKKLPGILDRYEAAYLYNNDETALFYQMLPNRTLALKGDDC
ncbi:hypothetical protein HPB50_009101 [Hyalomma asiaticum]|uniref:Uncharacterized protein n=1 Tax=Hyalomma asiaticum TaxID=266040 RepID=A0ACB7T067_HYAAI|nr:hypothetical protein HPB50_009101 [Hyalomma asiaticum]